MSWRWTLLGQEGKRAFRNNEGRRAEVYGVRDMRPWIDGLMVLVPSLRQMPALVRRVHSEGIVVIA